MVVGMFNGSICAMVTPMDAEGEIDWNGVERLVERQRVAGTDGLVVLGSTGEGVLLSREEQRALASFVRERWERFCILNVPTAGTRDAVSLVEMARDVGMDGVMAIVPFYVGPEFEGIREHFMRVAVVGVPVVVYHHPGRTGIRLSGEELLELLGIENVVGLKDASHDLDLVEFLAERVGNDQVILAGDDVFAYPTMERGGHGAISTLANLFPEMMHQICHGGDFALHESVVRLMDGLGKTTNPQGIKYAMSLKGLCRADVRLPLVLPKQSVRASIAAVIDEK
ncbi:MAG: 4-hydroxy-tetrahydrodipicolinate synthase [Chlamydiia bacterium]|nr:4-hydroxy-tetrahydrodipicolinate synthase [Chlamydiia bacterium]